MKVWHIGGPLHGLIEEYENPRGAGPVKLAHGTKPLTGIFGDDFAGSYPAPVQYHLQEFRVSETDAEVLAYNRKHHHMQYSMWVFIESGLNFDTARNMLTELLLLKYVRENGVKVE